MKKISSVFFRKRISPVRRLEKIANSVEKAPIVRIWVRLNQSATILALLVALVAFFLAFHKYNEDNKKYDEDRVAKAWDVLTRMAGKKANGGQVSAIEILVSHSISLDMVDFHDTYLANANLKGASLRGANFSGAILTKTNLQGADLTGANFQGATLIKANLAGAQLDNADLSHANLFSARVNISAILARDLTEADLTGVTFVFEDKNGEDIWFSYGDSIAESPEADDAQTKIDLACANKKYNAPQSDELPIKLPTRPCKHVIDYSSLQWWESFEYPSNLTLHSRGTGYASPSI